MLRVYDGFGAPADCPDVKPIAAHAALLCAELGITQRRSSGGTNVRLYSGSHVQSRLPLRERSSSGLGCYLSTSVSQHKAAAGASCR